MALKAIHLCLHRYSPRPLRPSSDPSGLKSARSGLIHASNSPSSLILCKILNPTWTQIHFHWPTGEWASLWAQERSKRISKVNVAKWSAAERVSGVSGAIMLGNEYDERPSGPLKTRLSVTRLLRISTHLSLNSFGSESLFFSKTWNERPSSFYLGDMMHHSFKQYIDLHFVVIKLQFHLFPTFFCRTLATPALSARRLDSPFVCW